jgi:CRP/FNR family transcriptional regulator
MSLEARVQAVVPGGFLARVDPSLAAEVLRDGHAIDLTAGQVLRPPGGDASVALVLEGLLRVYLASDAGRQVTVRYARPGDALGLVHLWGTRTAVSTAAVTASSLWAFSASRLKTLAGNFPQLASAVAQDCALRAADAMEELRLISFGTVRQRLARHLLDLAAADPATGELLAPLTQQQLADAAGTVREVVARTLKELRASGAIGEAPGGITVLDPAALDDAATAALP